MNDRLTTVFQGRFDSLVFILDLAQNDIGLAVDLGRRSVVPMPVANMVEKIMMHAMNRGWSESDWAIAIRLQEECSRIEMRAPLDLGMARENGYPKPSKLYIRLGREGWDLR